MASVIRVHIQGQAEAETSPPLDFNLADFAGQLPQVGDVVAPPPGVGARDHLWEVVYRMFDPGLAFDAGSCLRLVVRPRPPSADERAFLG